MAEQEKFGLIKFEAEIIKKDSATFKKGDVGYQFFVNQGYNNFWEWYNLLSLEEVELCLGAKRYTDWLENGIKEFFVNDVYEIFNIIKNNRYK